MLLLENLAWAVTASSTDWAQGTSYEERALHSAIQLGDEQKELQYLRDLTVFSFRLDSDAAQPDFERSVVAGAATRQSLRPWASL
jgi:hypothetical protein